MNWEYSAIAIAVILIISCGALVIMKKRGKADSTGKLYLFFSTVISIGFALLIPIFAKTLSGAFNTDTFTVILLALLIGLFMGVGFGALTMIRVRNAADKNSSEDEEAHDDEEQVQEDAMMPVAEEVIEETAMDHDKGDTFREAAITPEAEAEETSSETVRVIEASVVETSDMFLEITGEPEEATVKQEPVSDELPEAVAAATDEELIIETHDVLNAEEVHEEIREVSTMDDEAPVSAENDFVVLQDTEESDPEPVVSHEAENWHEAQKDVDTDRNTDRIGLEQNEASKQPSGRELLALLGQAQSQKALGNLRESRDSFLEALSEKPDKTLSTLIIIEICSLSKKLEESQYILDLLTSDQCSLMDEDAKEEILNNIS